MDRIGNGAFFDGAPSIGIYIYTIPFTQAEQAAPRRRGTRMIETGHLASRALVRSRERSHSSRPWPASLGFPKK